MLALWSGLGLAIVFVLLQFKQPQRTNPPVQSEIHAPAEIAAILQRSCYNCHSPWSAVTTTSVESVSPSSSSFANSRPSCASVHASSPA